MHIRNIPQYIRTPWKIILILNQWRISRLIPDKLLLQCLFFESMGYRLNLKDPQTFNEKIQWLKLYNRRPEYTMMADKYEVKKYVSDVAGEKYIIKTLGIWKSFNEIDFESLPDRFVLKCTHDSGSAVIVEDKKELDKGKQGNMALHFNRALHTNYFYAGREWAYKNIKPRIIAEEYMNCEGSVPDDYKIFCFDGIPRVIQVDFDRFKGHKRNLYTPDWKYVNAEIMYPSDPNHIIEKPGNLDEMLWLASKLSENIPHVRVDLYCINNEVYFGELTFYHGTGTEIFSSKELELKMGSWIHVI